MGGSISEYPEAPLILIFTLIITGTDAVPRAGNDKHHPAKASLVNRAKSSSRPPHAAVGKKAADGMGEPIVVDVLPAKLLPPRMARVFSRTRLFNRLDRLCSDHAVIWIAAPPGSGKTTLVGDYVTQRKLKTIWYQFDECDSDVAGFFHYLGMAAARFGRHRDPLPHLGPEYLAGFPVFARRFFEKLFRHIKAPYVLLLDNYQELAPTSAVHEALAIAISVLPPGATILVTSRAEPPEAFARARANGDLVMLGWEALRLTPEEAAGVVLLRGRGDLQAEELEALHRQTDGWVAGLALALEQGQANFGTAPQAGAPQALFDYFAAEIFNKTSPQTQDVLLKTALLPRIGETMAAQLTGNADAGRLLAELYRRNYFTYRYGAEGDTYYYQYHPLFQEFLLRRAKAMLPASEFACLQSAAAALLESSGQIEDAANLWRDAADWPALARLIHAHAPAFMATGRAGTMERWLRSLPSEVLASSAWLLYWLGLCRLPFAAEESRGFLERAYAGFEAQNDLAGLGLAWSGIIDTFVYAWGDFRPVDRWIAAMEQRLAGLSDSLPAAIAARVASGMFMALMYRQPQHPQMPLWADRVKRMVMEAPDARTQMVLGNQLLLYYTAWMGDFANARILLDAVRPSAGVAGTDPFAYIAWRTMQAGYHWFMAEHEACLNAVRDGLEVAERTGARPLSALLVSQGVIGSLTAGEWHLATELLRGATDAIARGRPLDRAHYHYLMGLDALFRQDIAVAFTHMHEAMTLADAAGVPFGQALYRLAFAHALFDRGQRRQALMRLAEARRIGRGMGSMNIEFGCLFSAVYFALERGKQRLAIPLLRKTLALARRHGYINRPLWTPTILGRLLIAALEHGIEIEYVQRLIRTRHLAPPPAAAALDAWPWPVEIRTLGKFALSVQDKPLSSRGKQQRKPLDLLKLLIVGGEHGLPVEQAIDALCPEMSGKGAYKSYAMALHRLRRLIGEDSVLTRDGRVSLNPRMCRVDAWVFEALLAGDTLGAPDPARSPIERAAQLYAGPFLNDEAGDPAITVFRERLHRKYLDAILSHGRALEARGDFEQALAWYRRGLDQDDLEESFYQRLLHCCQVLGRRAEGIAAYERCRTRLREALGIAPSATTDALRDALLGAR